VLKTIHLRVVFIVGAIIVIAAGSYGGYRYWKLHQESILLKADLARTQNEKSDLAQKLEAEQSKNKDLAGVLRLEQDKNNLFEKQISEISGAIGSLQKLNGLDQELLLKYSKVYFLSENYAPTQLAAIDPQYLYDKNKPQQLHVEVAPFFQRMLVAAAQEGIVLKTVSAFRSFYEQISVKLGHQTTYGSGANQFSADQGYSEHQLGTTVDVTAEGLQGVSLDFEKKPEYQWLIANAYKFGFILSYPKNNTYYHFEPWHWRFVGTTLATKLHNDNKYFYELTQREINPLLISIFD